MQDSLTKALDPMNEVSEKPNNSTDGAEQSLSSIQTSSKKPSKIMTSTYPTLSPLFEIYKNVRKEILDRGTVPKYPIGLKELNEALWGIHKKELMVIGARTSEGKTAFALQIAIDLAEKEATRVIYFSLEMAKEQIVERLLSCFCKIDNHMLRRGRAKEQVKNQDEFFKKWLKSVNILIDDRYGYNYEKMVEVCKIIKPDFIVLDYIQMVASKGFRSKLDAIEEYIRRLKQLSIEMNFGAIIISQINRSGAESPSMVHFKHAGILEEHADTCMVLSWDWQEKEYKINIEKQRHGATAKMRVQFLPQYSRFEDF